MNNYFTYNKVLNLFVTYFYHKEWHKQSLDYIKEKYFRVFNSLPDKVEISDGFFITSMDHYTIKHFKGTLEYYLNKWHIKKGNISSDDINMLFVVYCITESFVNPNILIKNYNTLFSSPKFINENSQIGGLHEVIKQTITELEDRFEDELLPYKRISKIVEIRKQME